MSNKKISELILTHPAFSKISEESQNKVINSIELLKFSIGQPLAVSSIRQDKIYLICEGEARLLGVINGDPVTIKKLTRTV